MRARRLPAIGSTANAIPAARRSSKCVTHVTSVSRLPTLRPPRIIPAGLHQPAERIPMADVTIADALRGKIPENETVTVKGWVRTRRDSKGGFSFLAGHDG